VNTRRSCLICSSPDKLSREHGLPTWLNDEVTSSGGRITHRYEGPPESEILRQWYASHLDIKVKAFCEPCNNGRMSQLETAAKPILTPLVHGRGNTLSTIDCRILTRWFIKTTLILELAGDRTQRVTPSALFDWVRNDTPPRQGLTLWVGAARAPQGVGTAGRSAESQLGNEPAQPAWMFVIVIRHLVLAAVGTSPGARAPHVTEPLGKALSQAWPPPLVLTYPPRIRLSRKQVPLILHMLATSLI
jgi:hypothetical protein